MILITHWELIKHLTLKEVKARYKQSFLGFFWVVLSPFFQMLIMSFIFSKVMRVNDLGVPYPVYLYAGLLPWLFFANSLQNATEELVENASLIKKIYFPREILVLSALLAKTFDFALSTLIFLLLMMWYRIPFTPYMFLFLPLFALQFLFTYGVSLFLAATNLFYRDVRYLLSLIITLWFYLTPVIYATEFFPPQYRWIFQINPMSVFINAYRQILLTNGLPNFPSLAIGVLVSVVIFIISLNIFRRLEGMFADVA